jgi:hypothetical protein
MGGRDSHAFDATVTAASSRLVLMRRAVPAR